MDSIDLQNNIKIFETNLQSLDQDEKVAERQGLENINVVAKELEAQEAKLKVQYDKIDKQSADQWEFRSESIKETIAKAKQSIETTLKQEPKADALIMYQTMDRVWTKEIPLYDIQTASTKSVELQKLYDQFQNLFIKYKNQKTGGAFVTGYESNLNSTSQTKEQLIQNMRNTMAEFSIRLSLLEKEILESANSLIANYKFNARKIVEKDTNVPSLRASLLTLQNFERNRLYTVNETRKAYQSQYMSFKRQYDSAKEKLLQQQKLIESTRQQAVVIKPLSLGRTDFPSPFSDTFTKDMTLKFQKYAMAKTDVSQGSQCSVDGAKQPPKNYQELLSDLMEPDLPYRGFLANYGTGSGKTRLSAITIEK